MKILDFPSKEDSPDGMKALLNGLVYIAEANKVYYDQLVKQGFTEQQALDIVKAWKWF